MSVNRSDKVLDEKTEYLFDWLTREKADAPGQDDVESHEKKFDSLMDELYSERKKLILYKPRTSR